MNENDNDNPELDGPAPTPSEMGMGGDTGGAPMSENEVCVPTSSLATPDEKDQMQTPAEGDKVQLNIEGTVSRTVGDKSYVTMSAVNGQEVKPNAPAPTEGDEESSLQQMAASQPDRY